MVVPGERKEDRYSVAYFCHPARETRLIAVPSEVVREESKKGEQGSTANSGGHDGKAITAEEHLRRKLVEAYGWEN